MNELLDARDVFYLVTGFGFIGLTVLPLLSGFRAISITMLYVIVGALLTLSPFSLFVIDPMDGYLPLKVVEHASELIVIISLAGAGLAIDRAASWKAWRHTWNLLVVTIPLTIIAIVWMGGWAGLPFATAMLLAASLAPTDPVLAREVQVSAPTQGEEDDVRVALTSEAGLNDGLAFPFVYLALAMAAAGTATAQELFTSDWLLRWLGFDVLYRIIMAVAIGWFFGKVMARLLFSSVGDASQNAKNAGLIVVGSTFLAYGLAEAVSAYGFLSVFIAARSGRDHERKNEVDETYAVFPHRFADQIEKILLAVMLIWLGSITASGMLSGWTWTELLIAVLLIFVVRPIAGAAGMIGLRGTRLEKFAIAFFGIRGFGSVFYLAYGQSHGGFDGMESAWRILIFTAILSIIIHGTLAPWIMQHVGEDKKKKRDGDAAVDPI